MKQFRLLLVDDNDLIRAGLNHVLSKLEFKVVGQASTLEMAAEALSKQPVDVVLLKHQMPDGCGIEFVKELRRCYPDTKVLLLLEEDEHFWEAIKSNADGYEMRQMPTYQLTAAIRAIGENYGWIGPMLARYLLKRAGFSRLSTAARQTPVNEEVVRSLSPRELAVIGLLSEGVNGQGIAQKLSISPKTVKLHISNCIKKLDVEDRTQAIAKFLRCKN